MDYVKQRIEAFWRDHARFGRVWSLEHTLITHFGRNKELMLPDGERHRNANVGWDPCLPEPGTPDYEVIEAFVSAAEAVIARRMPPRGDDRRRGYAAGRRADGGLNLFWAQPLQIVDGSEELKDALITELREATLGLAL